MGTLWNLQCRLLVAIQNNDISTAECLLERGVDADVRFHVGSQTRPAICLCVERGHVEMVQLLLKWGCSINQYDPTGQTPLHIAASHGRICMVDLLLKNRANVKAVTNYGHTALHLAAQQPSLEIVKMLVEAGSDLERMDHDGRTPLGCACIQGNARIVEYLVAQGAKVNIKDTMGNSPLLHATNGPHTSLDLVSVLLAAGAEVNLANKQGETPLLATIRGASQKPKNLKVLENDVYVVEALLHNDCDLTSQTPLGQSPLHLAVALREDALAEKLLRAGCNPNTPDALGLSPLFHMAKDGKQNLVSMAIAVGGDLRNQKWMKDDSLLSEIWDPFLREFLMVQALRFPRLKDLCRVVVRQYLERRADWAINSLPLPQSIKEFLKLNLFL
ncbi:serine/threonine-protein phosphatase 6 regulatory ankyrin repeat subunit A-like [Limulus polyphemus]|uniref:Serine/threonine-protein phosphatase 6 regulatory ankyrin repeat subunit A-like n=1 Tax=Limulus polyphemus TaxID=6850 RepID=A0ABM1S1G3_LIMPO|nr:serine/threonine-protein phosphatase 6 regulatory ankyrin repeat subunit A-like [Limulus polyphemus]